MADSPSLSPREDPQPPPACAWATWRLTLLMVALWLVWRLVNLRFFLQADLLGDEANYWECARRLQLSYHYSGPGIAAVVAAAKALFGDVEWGLRFPAPIAMAVTALLVGRMALRVSGDERAGFFSAALFLLFPLTALWSVLITYDPLYIACWLAATFALWLIVRAHRAGGFPLGWWAVLGLALGLGFLLKYTIVLLVPGLVLYLLLQRRTFRWDARLWVGLALSIIIFIAAIAPIWVWNQQEGWPTITYLRGHMNTPTDTAKRQWSPEWPLSYIGAQVALVGPPAAVLIATGFAAAWRRRRQDVEAWDTQLLLLCSAGVIILFFLAATAATRSEGNWALAGYPPLAVLAGLYTAQACRAGAWTPLVRRAWKWSLGFGVFAYLVTSCPIQMAQLPVIGRAMPLERFWGAHQMAAQVDELRQQVRAETGREPLIIAKTYLTASQMAFYLPDHPSVYCAASYLGWRRNTYDFWADTDMTAPALRGRPAILLGADPAAWRRAIVIGDIRTVTLQPKPIFIGYDYQGVQPAVQAHGGRIR